MFSKVPISPKTCSGLISTPLGEIVFHNENPGPIPLLSNEPNLPAMPRNKSLTLVSPMPKFSLFA